jgi:hypothetical protein
MTSAAAPDIQPFTARTTEQFLQHWDDRRNFLLGPELISFAMQLPPAEQIVDILRTDEKVKINFFEAQDDDEAESLRQHFRTAPLEQVIDLPFNLSHFDLHHWYDSGRFLADFQRQVMIPWRTFLSAAGLTFMRCYPIIFISGKRRSSRYHADISHVLAWQTHGVKTFQGFKDPEKYAPIQDVVDNRASYGGSNLPPDGIESQDILAYRMEPGDILWNQLQTPHWVTGSNDEIAVSVNISHGGVQHQGRFCANEQVLRNRWKEHPDEAWLIDERY